VKIVIFGVGGTDGEHQECQLEEFGELETRDYMSSGIVNAKGDFAGRSSCLFVVGTVDMVDAERDSEAFDGFVGRDIAPVLTMEYAYTATARSRTWQESASPVEEVLGCAVEVVVPDSFFGKYSVKCKVHSAVRHSPAKDVCPVRLAEDGYSP
jgi:hypothetical protein